MLKFWVFALDAIACAWNVVVYVNDHNSLNLAAAVFCGLCAIYVALIR